MTWRCEWCFKKRDHDEFYRIKTVNLGEIILCDDCGSGYNFEWDIPEQEMYDSEFFTFYAQLKEDGSITSNSNYTKLIESLNMPLEDYMFDYTNLTYVTDVLYEYTASEFGKHMLPNWKFEYSCWLEENGQTASFIAPYRITKTGKRRFIECLDCKMKPYQEKKRKLEDLLEKDLLKERVYYSILFLTPIVSKDIAKMIGKMIFE